MEFNDVFSKIAWMLEYAWICNHLRELNLFELAKRTHPKDKQELDNYLRMYDAFKDPEKWGYRNKLSIEWEMKSTTRTELIDKFFNKFLGISQSNNR
jgi:hypothetical protein